MRSILPQAADLRAWTLSGDHHVEIGLRAAAAVTKL
jgi:hypothetical protein